MHTGLVWVIPSILKVVEIPDMAVVTKARGLRSSDDSRPRDVVVLDFFAEGRHLVIDTFVTTVYINIIIQRAASIPGYAAKQAEDRKLLADRTFAQPIASVHGGPHVLVPFAIEDGGRLVAHALARMRALATIALEKGRRPCFAYRPHAPSAPTLSSMCVQRWQHRKSTWLHLAISKHVMRLVCPDDDARLRYI
jgi:hypothetical protein